MKYFFVSCCFLFIGLNLLSCSTTPPDKEIPKYKAMEFTKEDGSIVEIPIAGPTASQEALETFNEINSLNSALKTYDKGCLDCADPSVAQEIIKIATELRDESIDDVELAYRIAKITSSSSLDPKQMEQSRKKARKGKEILKMEPPPSLYVETRISTSVPDADIHHIPVKDYKKEPTSWKSYHFGKTIRIGYNMFRVQSKSLAKGFFEEEILVLKVPTIAKLKPIN